MPKQPEPQFPTKPTDARNDSRRGFCLELPIVDFGRGNGGGCRVVSEEQPCAKANRHRQLRHERVLDATRQARVEIGGVRCHRASAQRRAVNTKGNPWANSKYAG